MMCVIRADDGRVYLLQSCPDCSCSMMLLSRLPCIVCFHMLAFLCVRILAIVFLYIVLYYFLYYFLVYIITRPEYALLFSIAWLLRTSAPMYYSMVHMSEMIRPRMITAELKIIFLYCDLTNSFVRI